MNRISNSTKCNLLTTFTMQQILHRWPVAKAIKLLTNRLALKLMDLHAALNGYRFVLATSQAEKQQAYQLRYQVYNEAKYMTTASEEWTQLIDKYDERSAIFLAYHHSQPVGTLRLTPLANGSNTEDYFNIRLDQDRRHVVDIGKFAIDNRQRSQARVAGFGLVRLAYVYSLQNQIQIWLGCAPQGLLRSFRHFIPAHTLPQLPPTQQHLTQRTRRAGYFKKHGAKIQPFQMKLGEMDVDQGLYNLWTPLIKVSWRKLAKRLQNIK